MAKLNKEIRQEVMARLKGNWLMAVLVGFVSVLLVFASSSITLTWTWDFLDANPTNSLIDSLGALLISPFFTYGACIAFLMFLRGGELKFSTLFSGFSDFIRILSTYLLMVLYIILWMFAALVPILILVFVMGDQMALLKSSVFIAFITLIVCIPVMIKSLSYGMTLYILKDYPELRFNAAINLSMAMMRGNKMKLFLLYLNVTMWAILSMFTLLIGLLWVIPYSQMVSAAFYEDVKADYEAANSLNDTSASSNCATAKAENGLLEDQKTEMLGADTCCGDDN